MWKGYYPIFFFNFWSGVGSVIGKNQFLTIFFQLRYIRLEFLDINVFCDVDHTKAFWKRRRQKSFFYLIMWEWP